MNVKRIAFVLLMFMALGTVLVFAGQLSGVEWTNFDWGTRIKNNNSYGVTVFCSYSHNNRAAGSYWIDAKATRDFDDMSLKVGNVTRVRTNN
jgi:hypothetical protein